MLSNEINATLLIPRRRRSQNGGNKSPSPPKNRWNIFGDKIQVKPSFEKWIFVARCIESALSNFPTCIPPPPYFLPPLGPRLHPLTAPIVPPVSAPCPPPGGPQKRPEPGPAAVQVQSSSSAGASFSSSAQWMVRSVQQLVAQIGLRPVTSI